MREFANIQEFLRFLETRREAVRVAQKEGLSAAGDLVLKETRAVIGHYQQAAGPFGEWKPLSEATLLGGVTPEGHHFPGKIELGYAPPDNPLLRTGHMRGSIEKSVSEGEMVIGSYDPVAVDQEFGTEHIPARSFIGASMFRHAHEATKIAVHYIMRAFAGLPPPDTHSSEFEN